MEVLSFLLWIYLYNLKKTILLPSKNNPIQSLNRNCTSTLMQRSSTPGPFPPKTPSGAPNSPESQTHPIQLFTSPWLVRQVRALSRTTIKRKRTSHISPEMTAYKKPKERPPHLRSRWIYIWNMNGGHCTSLFTFAAHTKFVSDVSRVCRWREALCVCAVFIGNIEWSLCGRHKWSQFGMFWHEKETVHKATLFSFPCKY